MKTALITGASSGIGYELAKIFANNATNLVLVARTESKLEELSSILSDKGITIHILPLDLSQPDAAGKVFSFCEYNRIQIDYLINNAGIGDFGLFAESDWPKQNQMINLNINALTHLTRLFLPGMIRNKSGKIMNVASTAAFEPGPVMSVYFATKAYVLSFSEAISSELEGTGITVTVLCPGPTQSGFINTSGMGESRLVKGRKLPTSKEVAEYGYKVFIKGKTIAIHGLTNTIITTLIRFIPRPLLRKAVKFLQNK